MAPATIIQQAKADGVTLALSSTGSVKAIGHEQAVTRWLPVIREHKAELLDKLRAASEAAAVALKETSSPEEREVVRWLERILEPDPVVYRETLGKCRANPDALLFFLGLARGDDTGAVH